MRFGSLKVTGLSRVDKTGTHWSCLCDCGRNVIVRGSHLTSGHSEACMWCRKKTHGMSRTRLYKVWSDMKHRCQNENDARFKNYGGRGISVCKEWDSFESFMSFSKSNGYSDNLEIDRIDNDGDYCPSNCRFITKRENTSRAKSKYITYGGKTLSMRGWSLLIGGGDTIVQQRIRRGWSHEKAITTPVRWKDEKKRSI